MSRIYLSLSFAFGVILLLSGCTSETTPPAVVDADQDTTASVPTTETPTTIVDEIDPAITDSSLDNSGLEDPSEVDATDDLTGDDEVQKELTTFEDFLGAMQAKLQSPNRFEPPSQENIVAAIAIGEQGLVKLPGDENMIRSFTMLLYESLRLTSDPATKNERRLRLAELARVLVERNKEAPEQLGNLPSILLLEEAKAHLAGDNKNSAWKSILESRSLGLNQAEVILMDPAFALLLENEKALATVNGWVDEDLTNKIDNHESFPFDFSLPSFAGDEVALSDFKGKLLIVDIWGTWCPPCRAAIPHMVELLERRKDKVAVVGINIENPQGEISFEEAKAKYDEFVETQPINYPCVAGTRETVMQIPEFQGFPTLLFVDSEGDIRYKVTGCNPSTLEKIVDKLLGES